MILSAAGDTAAPGAGAPAWRLITQPDHAFFAAELLRLWRADGLPDHPRRDDLLFSTREHDNGWRELDSAPTVDAQGVPRDFLSTPPTLRREVWARGTRRYVDERPYAALLIVQHATHLFRDVEATAEWDPFLSELAELRRDLLARTGIAAETLVADHAWLDLVDRISLAACGARASFAEATGRRVNRTSDASGESLTLEISPFPLAGATTFQIPCRTVPVRAYAGDADFAVEAATAPWRALAATVR